MCERPFLKAARNNSSHDFSGFLAPCHDLFEKSDYLVGNLETPCDPQSSLTQDMYIFNAPFSFVEAVKDSGINMVTTATNHCMDRGITGLINTLDVLDKLGLEHTGTIRSVKDKNYKIIEFDNGERVGIISYTYGTNIMNNHVRLKEDEMSLINMLTPYDSGRNWLYDEYSYSLRARLGRAIPDEMRICINKLLGRSYNFAYTDTIKKGDIVQSYLDNIKSTITEVKQKADIVIICPHYGGQFNTEPGEYVETFTDFFEECGANVVIGNHPHVVQRFEMRKTGMIVAYSLGNVSMSLSTSYILLDNKPDYSIMFHLYIDAGEVVKKTFSIMVEKENSKKFVSLYPLTVLYDSVDKSQRNQIKENANQIYNRFLGTNCENFEIEEEYLIH